MAIRRWGRIVLRRSVATMVLILLASLLFASSADAVVGVGSGSNPSRLAPLAGAADTWAALPTANAPSPRVDSAAVWTGSQMLAWGGRSFDGTFFGDGARYTPASDSWTTLASASAPSPRAFHTAVWSGSEMIVWGGSSAFGSGFLNDGARSNPTTNTWSALPSANAPSARIGHTATWTGSQMIVFGGWYQAYGNFLGVGARYNPSSNSWSPISSSGAPSARANHSAVWTGTDLVVWGGCCSSSGQPLSDGASYDPATDTWRPVTMSNAPSVQRQAKVPTWRQ